LYILDTQYFEHIIAIYHMRTFRGNVYCSVVNPVFQYGLAIRHQCNYVKTTRDRRL